MRYRSCPATVSGEPFAHYVTGTKAGKTGDQALIREPGDLPDKKYSVVGVCHRNEGVAASRDFGVCFAVIFAASSDI